MEERRKSKRLELKASIQLTRLDCGEIVTTTYARVDVKDVSKSGLGFTCSRELEVGSFYDTKITIWTKEEIRTVIKIVRRQNLGNVFEYGCQFVGMGESDQLKIGIYQLFNEVEEGNL